MFITKEQKDTITTTMSKLKSILGHEIDMEFVITQNKELILLQQRRLHTPSHPKGTDKRTVKRTIELKNKNELTTQNL